VEHAHHPRCVRPLFGRRNAPTEAAGKPASNVAAGAYQPRINPLTPRATAPRHQGTKAPRHQPDSAGCETPVMAYDEELANRIRELVQREQAITEMRMFGGLAFLINGNMGVSARSQGGLLLRVDPADTEVMSSDPDARRFSMRGREMDGWLRIDPNGLTTNRQLKRWVAAGVAYARSLPPKR
jgi:TfoX N-terminal domain